MERLVVTMDAKPSWGHVWTPIKNHVFWYQEIVAPSVRALEIEIFQLQRTIEDLEKANSETNGSDHSLTMNFCGEHDSHQMISVMPTFTIDSTPINQICIFCKGLAHLVGYYPYRSNQVLIFVIEPIFGTTQPIILDNTQIPMT
jgi:hypothetical protein